MVSHDDKQEPHYFPVDTALKPNQAKKHQDPSKYPSSSCSLDWSLTMKHALAGCPHRLTSFCSNPSGKKLKRELSLKQSHPLPQTPTFFSSLRGRKRSGERKKKRGRALSAFHSAVGWNLLYWKITCGVGSGLAWHIRKPKNFLSGISWIYFPRDRELIEEIRKNQIKIRWKPDLINMVQAGMSLCPSHPVLSLSFSQWCSGLPGARRTMCSTTQRSTAGLDSGRCPHTLTSGDTITRQMVPCSEGVQANGQVLIKQNGQVSSFGLDLSPVDPAAHWGIPAQIRGVDVQDPFRPRVRENI